MLFMYLPGFLYHIRIYFESETPEHRIHICFLARMVKRYSMMTRWKYGTLPQDVHVNLAPVEAAEAAKCGVAPYPYLG